MALVFYYRVFIGQDKGQDLWFASPLISHNQATTSGKYAPYAEEPGPADRHFIDDDSLGRRELRAISTYKHFMAMVPEADLPIHTLHRLFQLEQQKAVFSGEIQFIQYHKRDELYTTSALALTSLGFDARITSHVIGDDDEFAFNFEIVGNVSLLQLAQNVRAPAPSWIA